MIPRWVLFKRTLTVGFAAVHEIPVDLIEVCRGREAELTPLHQERHYRMTRCQWWGINHMQTVQRKRPRPE